MSLKPEIIKGTELTLDLFLIALRTRVPATARLLVDGVSYDPPALEKKVEEARAYYKSVRTSNTSLKAARKDLAEKKPEIKTFVHALNTGITAFLGEGNEEIVHFGFKPNKARRRLSSEESQKRAEKAKRTRQARHTLGPRQKEAIHGDTPPNKTP